jgi:hypothetical protein
MAISTIVAGLSEIGMDTAVATIAAGAIEGGLVGGGINALEGKSFGSGALSGALTGGLGAGFTEALPALGMTGQGATIIGDTLGGAASAGILGQNVLKGAEGGLASGVISSTLGGGGQQQSSSTSSAAPTAGGGVGSAAGTAAPASVGAIDPNVVAPDVVNAPVTGTSMTVGGSPAGLPGGGGADTSLLGATGGPQTLGSGVTGSVGNGAASSSSSALSGSGTAGDQFSSAPSPNVGGLTQSNAAASAITGSAPMTTTSSLSDLGVSPLASAPTLGTAAAGPTNLLTQSDNMPIAGFNADGTAIDTSGTAPPGGNLLSTLAKNPMADVSMLGMAANLLGGNKTPAYSGQLAGAANTLAAQGNQLTGYLTSGALPPGMQDSINRATSAGAAQIRSMYAARGMTGSSAEQQDLQNLQIQAQAQAAQMAEQLYKQGISDMNMSDSLYQQLMQTFNARDAQTSNAIATFAGSLARMGMPATQQTGG